MRWMPRWRRCAVLCVIEPQSTGIGGDCFCLYAPAGAGKVIALNGSGRAPAAATIDWYEQHGIAAHGQHLGARRHRARRDQRLGDAAEGARPQGPRRTAAAGDPLSPPMAGRCTRRWRGTGSGWRRSCARTARTPSCRTARRPNAGDIFRNPALAETLRGIARHGAKAFYEGPVAADIVATLRARGGLHTEEDFAAGLANADFVEPITLNWHGYDVYQMPAQRPGHRRADDPGHARRAAVGVRRPVRRAALSPPHRGRAPGLSRPRRLRRRPVAGRRAGEEAAERRVPVGPARADRRRQGDCARCRPPARRCCRRIATRSISASSTRTATRAASSTRCSRASVRRSWPSGRA